MLVYFVMKTRIYTSLTDLVGHTPLLHIQRYQEAHQLPATLLAKLEYLNPSGSVKDRLAKALIEDAEQRGLLQEGCTIIEPTSGNTGIGLAAICAAKGYRLILTMPETMTLERRKLLLAYGAELVLTEGSKGMRGAIARAEELCESIEGAVIPSQFSNPANARMHAATTAEEIWQDTAGAVDIIVAGVGTGGTISGVSHALKQKNPSIGIIAVEPADSPMLSEGRAGAHMIQGIGAGFVPDSLNTEAYDEVLTVSNDEAFATARDLARREGLLMGISSGAALHAATRVAQREQNAGKTIVVILPDSADRYYSTRLFEEITSLN